VDQVQEQVDQVVAEMVTYVVQDLQEMEQITLAAAEAVVELVSRVMLAVMVVQVSLLLDINFKINVI
jgi:hypothetical protein